MSGVARRSPARPRAASPPPLARSRPGAGRAAAQPVRSGTAAHARKEVRARLGDCTRCRSRRPQHDLFGDGNPDADILSWAKAPGAEETSAASPSSAARASLLTPMHLNAAWASRGRRVHLQHREVPADREPRSRRPRTRSPPAALPRRARSRGGAEGHRHARASGDGVLLGRDVSITRVRGVWHDYRGTARMPTFHPAFILRPVHRGEPAPGLADLKAALDGRAPPARPFRHARGFLRRVLLEALAQLCVAARDDRGREQAAFFAPERPIRRWLLGCRPASGRSRGASRDPRAESLWIGTPSTGWSVVGRRDAARCRRRPRRRRSPPRCPRPRARQEALETLGRGGCAEITRTLASRCRAVRAPPRQASILLVVRSGFPQDRHTRHASAPSVRPPSLL